MSKKLILYELPCSPPVRAVKVLGKAIDLEFELKTIDLLKGEQLSEEFLKVNPTHTVPALDDNGTIIWDSHAIMMYLMDKYAKNDSFYPKNLAKRAEINQLLCFDISILDKFIAIMWPILSGVNKDITDTQLATLKPSYDSIERVLGDKNYVTGDEVTIADMTLVTTLTSLNLLLPIDSKSYPKITSWIKRMEEKSYYEPNVDGLKRHSDLIKKYVG